jgi:hypothetical protein
MEGTRERERERERLKREQWERPVAQGQRIRRNGQLYDLRDARFSGDGNWWFHNETPCILINCTKVSGECAALSLGSSHPRDNRLNYFLLFH